MKRFLLHLFVALQLVLLIACCDDKTTTVPPMSQLYYWDCNCQIRSSINAEQNPQTVTVTAYSLQLHAPPQRPSECRQQGGGGNQPPPGSPHACNIGQVWWQGACVDEWLLWQ